MREIATAHHPPEANFPAWLNIRGDWVLSDNWSVKSACVMPPGVVKKNGGGVLKLFPLFSAAGVPGLLSDFAKPSDADHIVAEPLENGGADGIAAIAKQVVASGPEAGAAAPPAETPTKMARKLSSGAFKAIKSASSQKYLLGRKLPPRRR